MPKFKLTAFQQDILAFVGEQAFGKNFYWTGGTLLAYRYLQHRFSEDLDFFSTELFADDDYLIFINALKKHVRATRATFTLQNNRRIYSLYRGKEIVKLELTYFPFPALKKRTALKDYSVLTDSLPDIMVNKVLSAYQRQEVKDIYDLYCYLTGTQAKYSILKLISLVEKKFGLKLEPTLCFAKFNTLAAGLDKLQPLLFKPAKNLAAKVKSFFQSEFDTWAKLETV